MKRLTSIALSLAILASAAISVSAANVGEVVDYALHTDIVAQIDGHPLRSYNVGGRTAVVAEDLVGYGFRVVWNEGQRMLGIYRTVDSNNIAVNPSVYPNYVPQAVTAPIGSRAEAILATDIRTSVNQQPVESFNINGQTLIWLSDLQAYGQLVWDGESRTANLVMDAPADLGVKDELTHWTAGVKAASAGELDKNRALEVVVTRWTDENDVVVVDSALPFDNVSVEFSQDGVFLMPGLSSGPDYESYPFGKACRILARSTIPSVFRDGDYYFTTKNTAKTRQYVWDFFQVTYNGKRIPGDLWWTGRDGSRALRFDFDEPVSMMEGDVLKLWVGLSD